MFIKTMLISLLFVSFSAFAGKSVVDCSAAIKQPVRVVPTTDYDLARSGTAGGSAMVDRNWNRTIKYDRELDKVPEMKNHVLAHECAHHTLGHVSPPQSRRYYADEHRQETDADCLASKILVDQLGYGEQEFAVIGEFLRVHAYDSERRIQHIQQCAK